MKPQLVCVEQTSVSGDSHSTDVGVFTDKAKLDEFIAAFNLNKPEGCDGLFVCDYYPPPINPSFAVVFGQTSSREVGVSSEDEDWTVWAPDDQPNLRGSE